MKKHIQTLIKNKNSIYKKAKKWKIVVGLLSVISIFFTIYSLRTPAITESNQNYIFNLIDGYDGTVNQAFSWKTEQEGEHTLSYELPLYFVDMSGNSIEGKDLTLKIDGVAHLAVPFGFGYEPTNNPTGENLIQTYGLEEYIVSNGNKYKFDHAEVLVNGEWQSFKSSEGIHWNIWCANSASGIEPENSSDYGWRGQYEKVNSDGTITSTSYNINNATEYKLVFELVRQGDSSVVQSLGASSGINFKLFNYTGTNGKTGINDNGVYDYFTFRNSAVDLSFSINENLDADGFGENKIKVLPNLDSEGNPVFDCRSTEGCSDFSLGYLFGSTKNPLGNTPNGVESYSPTNTPLQNEKENEVKYYYYDSTKNAVDYNIDTEQFMLRNYKERTFQMTTFENEANRYEFLPFNYWTKSEEYINQENNRPYNYVETEMDHWYGMTMEFEFRMPKNGTINGEDMIFSFSGDDDVWVFIDDVLILDLGGTHGAVDGTINFRTGEVKAYMNWDGVNNVANANITSIYEAYTKANALDTTMWNQNNTTYENYSKHTLKFFYLERGASVANCKIRFNIPVLPTGSLSVQKKFLDTDKYNEHHEFTLFDNSSSTPQPVPNTKYTIDGIEYYTDNNGKFTLKNNEIAVFELTNYNTYYVEETEPGAHSILHSCTIDGLSCEKNNKSNLVTITPESRHEIIFTNKIKTFDFKVSKIVPYDIDTGTDTFSFKITLKDLNDLPVDIADDTDLKYTVDHQNGIITFTLKNKENITIKEIPIDTIVKLEEINHEGYNTIIKSGDIVLANGDTLNDIIMNANKDITVYNIPGVRLPDTGGTGILRYLITGISLIVISIICGYNKIHKLKGSGK